MLDTVPRQVFVGLLKEHTIPRSQFRSKAIDSAGLRTERAETIRPLPLMELENGKAVDAQNRQTAALRKINRLMN
ncbi:hypothetical protein EVAR_38761_1 [Eumeta japonica]|uniref:Uncharacterized protein n=1 Tax=Eumeta variegata TaxID=151549 RepID=A0A4C1WMM2_EUMVA|nr:hypothetical protein EVAR_38761_1 [Eumeta japonica]